MVQTRRSSFAIPSLSKTSSFTNRAEKSGVRRSLRLKQKTEDEPVATKEEAIKGVDALAVLNKRAGSKHDEEVPDANEQYLNRKGENINESDQVLSVIEQAEESDHVAPGVTGKTSFRHNETEPPEELPDSTQNAGGNFLRGINLENCSDLLSIPDPPSPLPASRRTRRRQSSPILHHPFRNVSNTVGAIVQKNIVPGNKISSKRSRKSLCHVPLPAVLNGFRRIENKQKHENPKPAAKDDERKDDGELSIFLDDDDNDTTIKSNRKRRTSIFVPRNVEDVNDGKAEGGSGKVGSPLFPIDMGSIDTEASKHSGWKKRQSFVLPTDLESPNDVGMSGITNARKKRQSMFLPSNVESLIDVDMSSPEPKKKRGSIVLPSNVESSLLDSHSSNPMRRKKRQSFVLPNDVTLSEEDEDGVGEFFQDLKAYGSKKESSAAASIPAPVSSSPSSEHESPTDLDKNAALRDMVRAYCSLPEATRNSSKHAEDIERMTGYPLLPLTEAATRSEKSGDSMLHDNAGKPDLNWSSSPERHRASQSGMDLRRHMLLTLGPLVERIETRKAVETKLLEDMTGCRTERSKSGKPRYVDISTKRKVNALQYKKKYLSALEEIRKQNQKQRMAWMDSTLVTASNTGADPQSPRKLSPNSSPMSVQVSSTSGSPGVVGDIDALSNADSGVERDESMELCDASESMLDIEKSPLSASGSTETESRLTHRLSTASGFDISISMEQTGNGEQEIAGTAGDTEGLLLPLPSRGEESRDPDIFAAEQRLWSAIDSALEAYSRDVLAIRAARRMGVAPGSAHS